MFYSRFGTVPESCERADRIMGTSTIEEIK